MKQIKFFFQITAIQTDVPFLSVKELVDSLELWLVNDAGEWMKWTVNIEAVNKSVELKEQVGMKKSSRDEWVNGRFAGHGPDSGQFHRGVHLFNSLRRCPQWTILLLRGYSFELR